MQKSPQRECEHEKKNAVNMHGKGNIGKVIKNKKQKNDSTTSQTSLRKAYRPTSPGMLMQRQMQHTALNYSYKCQYISNYVYIYIYIHTYINTNKHIWSTHSLSSISTCINALHKYSCLKWRVHRWGLVLITPL